MEEIGASQTPLLICLSFSIKGWENVGTPFQFDWKPPRAEVSIVLFYPRPALASTMLGFTVSFLKKFLMF